MNPLKDKQNEANRVLRGEMKVRGSLDDFWSVWTTRGGLAPFLHLTAGLILSRDGRAPQQKAFPVDGQGAASVDCLRIPKPA